MEVRLTQFSHGAGCGCKISPAILDTILHGNISTPATNLLVGNSSKDDAAAYDLGNGQVLISTTDFFMPIVDDPFTFGKIAACNAISDVYAMGGKPILAVAILGWPIDKIPAEVAQKVLDGAKSMCLEAGTALGGGHSIDAPEPIFGLAVNGLVRKENLKQNNTAKKGDLLFLSKPLGIGILTTAEKKGLLQPKHQKLAIEQMVKLNKLGQYLGEMPGVSALTDVTGFGLLGHLCEMAEGANLSVDLNHKEVPLIAQEIKEYIQQGSVPGGTKRNWSSYGQKISPIKEELWSVLADPQTSGGLLIAVHPERVKDVIAVALEKEGISFGEPIGVFTDEREFRVQVY